MPQQQKDDPNGRRKIEPGHPFQEVEIAFDLRESLLDGDKSVLVRGDCFSALRALSSGEPAASKAS
jgi:hypothetical protein